MGHGVHGKHKAGKPAMRSSKSLGVRRPLDKQKAKKKTKAASTKNQIRAIQRLLRKDLPAEAQDAQEKRLEELKKQSEKHQQAELERKMSLRYRRVKFFERRKIERRIKHLEKLLEDPDVSDAIQEKENSDRNKQLAQLKEDLEYVRFFPKTEKYVSLYMGNEDEDVAAKRGKLRLLIKDRLQAAAASGLEPDEMDDGNDSAMAVTDDDFFLAASESEDGEAGNQFSLLKSYPEGFKNHKSKHSALPTVKQSSGSKKQQVIELHSADSGSKFRNQRPTTFRIKGKTLAEQVQPATRKDKKMKDQIGGQDMQKLKFPSHSRSLLQTESRISHQRLHPNRARKTGVKNASYGGSLKKNADLFTSSYASEGVSKEAPVQELGSTTMDGQRKRRRKHRPKKKKA